MFRVPGNHGKMKKLLTALESTQTLKVQEIVNPHTLNGFLRKTLKEEHVGPLVPKVMQRLLVPAIEEAKDDPDAQVRLNVGRIWQEKHSNNQRGRARKTKEPTKMERREPRGKHQAPPFPNGCE